MKRSIAKQDSVAPVPSTRLQEVYDLSYGLESAGAVRAMVRTQIYLTVAEHEFLQSEARKTKGTMASVIRDLIDAKMSLPEDVWSSNPLLEETPEDPAWDGIEDASVHLDHYLYGTPKVIG